MSPRASAGSSPRRRRGRPAGGHRADEPSVPTPQSVREVLQVVGEVRGAVEFDQPPDERADDDVCRDERVHIRTLSVLA